jgi:hypothetical protein
MTKDTGGRGGAVFARVARPMPIAMAGVALIAVSGSGSVRSGGDVQTQSAAQVTAAKAREVARFSEGFERPKASGWGLSLNDGHKMLSSWPTRGPVRRVSGRSREGRSKIWFEVVPQPKSFRSEITRKTVPMGSDCWYGFSVNVPKRWQTDPKGTILAQWHALVGRNVDNYPVVALYLINDTWQVRMNWNGQGDTSQGPGWHQKKFVVGAARKGGWTDWVVRAKWSYRSGGLLEVWHDGRKVVRHQGPNEYVNATGPYFKMGIYHPAWRHADARIPPGAIPLVSYADAVRFSRGGGYASVRPR